MKTDSFYIVTNWEVRGDKEMRVFLTQWDYVPERQEQPDIQGHVADSVGIVGSYSWPYRIASQWTWTPDTERNALMEGMNK